MLLIHLWQVALLWTWRIIVFQSLASGSCNSLEQAWTLKQREILKSEQSKELSLYEMYQKQWDKVKFVIFPEKTVIMTQSNSNIGLCSG